jgi:putative tryptophan/tyrosine transport system substrate-binding protein
LQISTSAGRLLWFPIGRCGQSLVADLVGRRVAVPAATGGTVSARAGKSATTTIPVVFTTGDDPVKAGLVASLNRPGGNLTGISQFGARLGAKRLALLHELVPATATIAILLNPTNPDSEDEAKDLQEAAAALGIEILVLHAARENEIDAAFRTLLERRAGALMVGADTFFTSQRAHLATLSTHFRVPTADVVREFVEAGGLVSYGASLAGVYRQAGVYAGRILKGDKPSNLPVQLPTTFELVINLKAAKALGIEVPPTLLAHASAAHRLGGVRFGARRAFVGGYELKPLHLRARCLASRRGFREITKISRSAVLT